MAISVVSLVPPPGMAADPGHALIVIQKHRSPGQPLDLEPRHHPFCLILWTKAHHGKLRVKGHRYSLKYVSVYFLFLFLPFLLHMPAKLGKIFKNEALARLMTRSGKDQAETSFR